MSADKAASCAERIIHFAFQSGLALLRVMGPVAASNFAGTLASTTGPYLRPSRTAMRNLELAYPQSDVATRRRIIRAVWRNLGCNIGELPHLAQLKETPSGPGWEISGRQNLPPGQAIFFSAHLGNWEMILPIAAQLGLAVSGAYRRASNPAVESAIQALRQANMGGDISMFPKGSKGARAALKHLAQGSSLGLLVDQKMNDGIAVPFFGRPAMTAPAVAQLALRFGLPLIPIRIERISAARLRLICEPCLTVPITGESKIDTLAVMTAVNARVEQWVRADPGAWLWLHRRWPKNDMTIN